MGSESRGFDPDTTARIANELDELAGRVDRAAELLPEGVDAGPFGKMIRTVMESVGANAAATVIRLCAAADQAREAATRQAATEESNAQTFKDLLAGPLDEAGDHDSGRGETGQ